MGNSIYGIGEDFFFFLFFFLLPALRCDEVVVLVGPLGCVYHLSGTLSNSNRWFLFFFSLSGNAIFFLFVLCDLLPLLVLSDFYDDMDGGSWGTSTGWVFFFFFSFFFFFLSLFLFVCITLSYPFFFFFFSLLFRKLGMFVLHLHLILLHPLGLGSLVMEMGIL